MIPENAMSPYHQFLGYQWGINATKKQYNHDSTALMYGGRRNQRWQKGGYTLNEPKRYDITTVRSPERKKGERNRRR